MRPIEKGSVLILYTDYGQARHDLAERIGYYCSYCEMKVFNSIEVEHILPQNQGGAVLNWSNFLLSCKYCNTIKSDHNANITDYFWPDRDNTDLAFEYDEVSVISPKKSLSTQLNHIANLTINLMGLSRSPGNPDLTLSDTRWRSRKDAWDSAKLSYNNWKEAPIIQLARSIAQTSLLGGHYSIWCEVFKDEQMVLDEIDNLYYAKSLFKQRDSYGVRVIRLNALL